MPTYISKITYRNIGGLRRSRMSQEFGLACYRCGKPFKIGDKIIIRGQRRRRYYCISCARKLYLYPPPEYQVE